MNVKCVKLKFYEKKYKLVDMILRSVGFDKLHDRITKTQHNDIIVASCSIFYSIRLIIAELLDVRFQD